MIDTRGVLFHVMSYYTAMKRKAVCPTTEQTDGCQGPKLSQGGWTHEERGGHCRALEVTNVDKFTHRRRNSGGQRAKGTGFILGRWGHSLELHARLWW